MVKMLRSLPPAALFLISAMLFAAAPQAKPPAKKPTPPKTTSVAKSKAKKAPSRTSSASKRSKTGVRRAARQTAPGAERIREIQQALAERGYDTPVDGVWSAASIEALKKFQIDQKLPGRGKIDSLSLIALGLGPKYDTNPGQLPQAPPERD